MRIGELAASCGITAKTVRFYEQSGLIPAPTRTPAGYRDYSAAAVPRLRFIRTAQATGLTLAEITDILAIRDDGRAPCAHVAALIDTHLADIRHRITQLRDAETEFQHLATRAAALDPADCTNAAEDVCRIFTTTKPSSRNTQTTKQAFKASR